MKTHFSKVKLSIRRIEAVTLPGDDSSLANVKLGASMKGNAPLRGLSYKEEIKYLPEIVGYSPNDQDWRKVTKEYWNNISVPIPADGITAEELQGKILEFTVAFENEATKQKFEEALEFEEKAAILMEADEKGTAEVIEGIGDYVLFRYSLVYGRVANSSKDIRKSPKIRFYLHSKQNEVRYAHKTFKLRVEANNKFTSILDNEKAIDALLLLFKQDLRIFSSLQDKHLVLETFVKNQPQQFLNYINDSALIIKALIQKGVADGIINNPTNTDSYYYGESNEICLGTTLTNAVLFFKSPEPENKKIVEAIKAQIKNS